MRANELILRDGSIVRAPKCDLHARHSPKNYTVEIHHVVPVAWQLFWQPPSAPFPGPDTEGRGELWDDRTIALCPTGHRNVHYWIVKFMRQVVKLPSGENDDPQAIIASLKDSPHDKTSGWAGQALRRFYEAHGALPALAAAGEWGQA